jgi:hypothetical protein
MFLLMGDFPVTECYMLLFQSTVCFIFVVGVRRKKFFLRTPPMKMEQTVFWNICTLNSDAGASPKSKNTKLGTRRKLTSRVNTCFLTVLLFACLQSLLVWTFDIERVLFLTLRHVKIVLMSSSTMVLMCATPCVYCLYKMDNTSEWTLYFSFLNSSRKNCSNMWTMSGCWNCIECLHCLNYYVCFLNLWGLYDEDEKVILLWYLYGKHVDMEYRISHLD